VLDLVEHCGRAYVLSDEAGRRDYNQAWFEAIYLDADDEDRRPTVTRVRRTPLLASLHERRESGLAATITQEQQCRRGEGPAALTMSVFGTLHIWWS
jgi:hypothetical protein